MTLEVLPSSSAIESTLLEDNDRVAEALATVLDDSKWDAVIIARAYIDMRCGRSVEEAARQICDHTNKTLEESRATAARLKAGERIAALLKKREKLGSAENPVTKLFPGTVAEQHFVSFLEALTAGRSGLRYEDNREVDSLKDFTIYDRRRSVASKRQGGKHTLREGC